MTYTIGAIPTWYKGYKYRSTLEARWAVFFDAAGIRYIPEPQGYEGAGCRYLPDFFLPDFNVYAEVKPGDNQLFAESQRIGTLIDHKLTPIHNGLLLLGDIPWYEARKEYPVFNILYWCYGVAVKEVRFKMYKDGATKIEDVSKELGRATNEIPPNATCEPQLYPIARKEIDQNTGLEAKAFFIARQYHFDKDEYYEDVVNILERGRTRNSE